MRVLGEVSALAILALLVLASCTGEERLPPEFPKPDLPTVTAPELKTFCNAETQSFGAELREDDPLDATVLQRFGRFFSLLVRQDGHDFGDGQVAFSGRVLAAWVEDAENSERITAFERAFGKRLLVSEFSRVNMMNPRTILVPVSMAGAGGIEMNFVFVVTKAGDLRRTLFSQDDLNGALRGVTTMKGALDLLEWRNMLGYEYPSGGGVKPKCTARSVAEAGDGWTIAGVSVLSNCDRTRYRDFFVSRTGKIDIVSETVSVLPPPFCVF